MLSEQQIHHFRTHGYALAHEFFNAEEVAAMRAELDRFVNDGLIRNVTTEGDGQTTSQKKQNLQLCPMAPHSSLFKSLPFEPKVLEAVTELIGEPFLLHLDQVFLKPAKTGTGTSWHQDNAYFKIDQPLKGTAMWIAIHDATVENGTMHLIPDVFNQSLEHERDPMSDHHIRCYPDESQAVPCELKAGGVAFFCYGTPHCTRNNTSDSERAGAAFHFLRVDQAKPELIPDDRDYRPYLTGPKASGGQNEYGETVAGQFPRVVDEILAKA